MTTQKKVGKASTKKSAAPAPKKPAAPENKDQETIQNYLAGKIKPEGEYLEYLVQQLQQAVAEAEATRKSIAQSEQRLSQLRQRLIELQGGAEQTAQAIIHFHALQTKQESGK